MKQTCKHFDWEHLYSNTVYVMIVLICMVDSGIAKIDRVLCYSISEALAPATLGRIPVISF